MGTSLSVSPFADLIHDADALCARLLINMNQVGGRDHNGQGFRFDCHDNYRDAALLGPCDDAVSVGRCNFTRQHSTLTDTAHLER